MENIEKMGKSKEDYEELCRVEMPLSFYEANEDLFKDNECHLKAVYAINNKLKNDPKRKILMDDMLEARAKLNEYEYEINYKRQINNYEF